MTVLDFTDRQHNPHAIKGKHKLLMGKVLERDPASITGIVIHQTACVFDVGPQRIKAAGGDRVLGRNLPALEVACHAIAFQDGTVVHANPLRWWVHHGNGFNATTLGLEIEGVYRGDASKALVGKETALTAKTLSGAKRALRYLLREGRALGMPLTHVYAHRQSSADRRGDPGEEIWKALVVRYAMPGAGVGQRAEAEAGSEQPEEWGGAGGAVELGFARSGAELSVSSVRRRSLRPAPGSARADQLVVAGANPIAWRASSVPKTTMAKLEELTQGTRVRGLTLHGVATVRAVQWFGGEVMQVKLGAPSPSTEDAEAKCIVEQLAADARAGVRRGVRLGPARLRADPLDVPARRASEEGRGSEVISLRNEGWAIL